MRTVMIRERYLTGNAYISDVLVGLLGSTDLMSLRVHVDLSLALLVHFFVLQLQE